MQSIYAIDCILEVAVGLTVCTFTPLSERGERINFDRGGPPTHNSQ